MQNLEQKLDCGHSARSYHKVTHNDGSTETLCNACYEKKKKSLAIERRKKK